MSWQQEVAKNITTVKELAQYLPLSAAEQQSMEQVCERFPMSITRYYLDLIDANDPDDPLRKMCVPAAAEQLDGGSFDTSGEKRNTRVEGLQHKYEQTALILSTNICALYCRHCFRKRLVGVSEEENARRFHDILAYLRQEQSIDNVLISGGDAFMNSNRMLEYYLRSLSGIEHIRILRFGTRTPVVLPSRINDDPELLQLFSRYSQEKTLYVITQFNHPRELTAEARRAIELLFRSGVRVCNQTVLLRGVNDDAQTLSQLMNGLAICGAIPYYLFQCRPVSGVGRQFQVPLLEGNSIVAEARSQLSGLAKRFRYVMSHESGKIEIVGSANPGRMIFKYHQAREARHHEAVFIRSVTPEQCWLPQSELLLACQPSQATPQALSPEKAGLPKQTRSLAR